MAIDAAGKLRLHKRLAARIEMANQRVLHQPRRDLVKKPNLSEQAKGLRVIGDGARQPQEVGIALEDSTRSPAAPRRLAVIKPTGPAPTTRCRMRTHPRLLTLLFRPSHFLHALRSPDRRFPVALLRQIDYMSI